VSRQPDSNTSLEALEIPLRPDGADRTAPPPSPESNGMAATALHYTSVELARRRGPDYSTLDGEAQGEIDDEVYQAVRPRTAQRTSSQMKIWAMYQSHLWTEFTKRRREFGDSIGRDPDVHRILLRAGVWSRLQRAAGVTRQSTGREHGRDHQHHPHGRTPRRQKSTSAGRDDGDDHPDHADAAYIAAAEERLARAQATLEAQRQQTVHELARILSRVHNSLVADHVWEQAAQ